MSETTVRQDWCPVHGNVKVQRFASPNTTLATGTSISWWECPRCMEVLRPPRREDAAGAGHHAPHAKRFAVGEAEECVIGSYVRFEDYETLRRQYDATAEGYRAALSTAERERDELQRIVDLVNAEGSIVKPSTLNRGRVVVVDGRTGLDASEATALEAIAALFEEEDGGESPGRLYITHRVPSGGET